MRITQASAKVLNQISITLSATLNLTLPKGSCTRSHFTKNSIAVFLQEQNASELIYIPTYSTSPECSLCSDTTLYSHNKLTWSAWLLIMSSTYYKTNSRVKSQKLFHEECDSVSNLCIKTIFQCVKHTF